MRLLLAWGCMPALACQAGAGADCDKCAVPSLCLLRMLLADKLPADWFTGMGSLQTFMCANCNWAEAADPDMAAWQALSWLDLSGNPLQLGAVRADSSSANMLPAEWAPLNLLALKVRAREAEGAAATAHTTVPCCKAQLHAAVPA